MPPTGPGPTKLSSLAYPHCDNRYYQSGGAAVAARELLAKPRKGLSYMYALNRLPRPEGTFTFSLAQISQHETFYEQVFIVNIQRFET